MTRSEKADLLRRYRATPDGGLLKIMPDEGEMLAAFIWRKRQQKTMKALRDKRPLRVEQISDLIATTLHALAK